MFIEIKRVDEKIAGFFENIEKLCKIIGLEKFYS